MDSPLKLKFRGNAASLRLCLELLMVDLTYSTTAFAGELERRTRAKPDHSPINKRRDASLRGCGCHIRLSSKALAQYNKARDRPDDF